jgi:serine/threonine protein kinase/tetratricopeptide (TPR) repeat protein
MGRAVVGEIAAPERFEIRRRLGEGAFGEVFEAWDAERRSAVAVKRLHRLHPTAIYRFKKEFRALADVTHPNLVQLYELLSEGQDWFFTMECVHGTPLLEWLRPRAGGASTLDAASGAVTIERAAPRGLEALVGEADMIVIESGAVTATLDVERTRAAFVQLAEGVSALHAAGKLHRDLKSQNVLVTPEGRVVLLDFGLVHELARDARRDTHDADIVGTPLYMSPEQAAGSPLGEASDWYAVGVMLYVALTGQFPFEGRLLEVLVAKQTRDPVAPHLFREEVPADLDALCMALLRRQPDERPTGAEIRARLVGRQVVAPRVSLAPGERPFVGRDVELSRLREAARTAREGRPRTLFVHGRSGMGKSALVRHFLDRLVVEAPGTLVLEGRCYASESVPFKAFDSVVDRLGRHLASLAREALAPLLPPHVGELAALFPTLRRVPAIDAASARVALLPDPIERRRRALGALRALLARLAAVRPVVVFVDDLQWGDADSALALAQLVQSPDAPPFFFLGTYRSEEAGTSPFLSTLGALAASVWDEPEERLAVEALASSDARALATSLLAQAGLADDPRFAGIADEADGSPLFIDQLATAAQERRAREVDGTSLGEEAHLALSDVIAHRVAQLPESARRLLDTLAVAGQPIPADVLRDATGLESLETAGLRVLHAARLVRTRSNDGREQLEVYHDRIRETVTARLATDAATSVHRGLALALEASPDTDDETRLTHWRAAGEFARAFAYAERAATRAYEALAFDHAAQLYREALALRPASAPRDGRLETRLGDALRDAGRGAEAARAYADAARLSGDDDTALELRRQAGEQYLAGGHLDEARRELGDVLAAVGMAFPKNTGHALAAFFARRAQVRLRGLSFTPRPAGSVRGRERLKMDVCWTIATGFAMIDPVRAGAFQSVHLLLALDSGDVSRIARTLAVEVPFAATAGTSARARTALLTRRAKEFAAEVAEPFLDGLLTSTIGGAAWLEGRWADGHALTVRADDILRTRCTGVAWLRDTNAIVLFDCLYRLGRWREVNDQVPALLADARMRGDLYMEIYVLVKFVSIGWLASGDTRPMHDELAAAIARWSNERFSLLHYWETYSQIEVALASGRPGDAVARARGYERGVRDSLLLQLQLYRVSWADVRGRAALALALIETGPERESLLRDAVEAAAVMGKEPVPWSRGLGALLEAGLCATRGEQGAALASLDEAEASLTLAGMGVHLAVLRARRAELCGDVAALEAAHAALGAEGIVNPRRLVAVLAPGRWS